jgi:Arc/MetJ family transcription regulator
MRITLNIEEELLALTAELTGIKEKTSLVRLGLEALVARESAKSLAALGGTEKNLGMVPRRRISDSECDSD